MIIIVLVGGAFTLGVWLGGGYHAGDGDSVRPACLPPAVSGRPTIYDTLSWTERQRQTTRKGNGHRS